MCVCFPLNQPRRPAFRKLSHSPTHVKQPGTPYGFFIGHTPLTEQNGHTDCFSFLSTSCRKRYGFHTGDLRPEEKSKNKKHGVYGQIQPNTGVRPGDTKKPIRGARNTMRRGSSSEADSKKIRAGREVLNLVDAIKVHMQSRNLEETTAYWLACLANRPHSLQERWERWERSCG